MTISAAERTEFRRETDALDCVISAAYGVGPDYVRTLLKTFRRGQFISQDHPPRLGSGTPPRYR